MAWRPDTKAGVDLYAIQMTDIAATILKALGIDNRGFGERPPLVEIFK